MLEQKIIEHFLLTYLIATPLLIKLFGKPPLRREGQKRTTYYIQSISGWIAIILMFLILDSQCFTKIDFAKIGKGFIDDLGIISGLFGICFFPLISVLFLKKSFVTTTGATTEVMGLPERILPKNRSELLLFTQFIILGVVFEELLCRQFDFYFLNKVFGLRGDLLLVVTSLLFTIPHHYKKISTLSLIFILGLLFGKSYQYTGTIFFPIGLHLAFNSTIIVLAWKRINKKNDLIQTIDSTASDNK